MDRLLRHAPLATLAALLAACSAPDSPRLPSLIPARAARARDLGPVDRGARIRLVLGFALRDSDVIAEGGREPLSPGEFGDRHGAREADYAAVRAWAQAAGLVVARADPGRSTLTVDGDADAIERAFHTRLHVREDALGLFRAPVDQPELPPPLAAHVITLVGLDGAARFHPAVHFAPDRAPRGPLATGKTGSNTPADLRGLYGAGNVPGRGEGQTLAILGANQPPDLVQDLGAFLAQYQLPALAPGQYTQILDGGANRDAPDGLSYTENVLDAEIALAFAPAAKVVHVLVAENGLGLFTDGIAYIVNHLPQAHAVSLSYGSCERLEAFEMPVMNALFAQARAEGQQWFVATGDHGTDGCRDGAGNRILAVGWPASSPSVIGVGGTEQDPQGAEQAWGPSGGAGGGGVSEAIDKPAYQIGVGPLQNDGARHEPDVAALAGPPWIEIVSQGQTSRVGGTSAATPMWAGIWTLIDQARGGRGLPSGIESLYALGALGHGFHDVTVGGNGDGTTPGFPALPGYDLATGWGTPDLPSLIAGWK